MQPPCSLCPTNMGLYPTPCGKYHICQSCFARHGWMPMRELIALIESVRCQFCGAACAAYEITPALRKGEKCLITVPDSIRLCGPCAEESEAMGAL